MRELLKRRFAGRIASGGAFRGPGMGFTQWTDVSATDVTDAGEATYSDDPGSAIELGPVSDTNTHSDADDGPDDASEQR